MKLEEEYQDVLHNIETTLVQVYRERDELTDWEALTAVNNHRLPQAHTQIHRVMAKRRWTAWLLQLCQSIHSVGFAFNDGHRRG